MVLDYGIPNGDGSWRLASGADVLDAEGAVIAAPTRADITAQARDSGTEWRVEEIGFSEIAAIDVEHIGLYVIDETVVDYTVRVTDRDGDFHVWARNLDRALEMQFKYGDARDFNLRNFKVDFDTLDEVGSDDGSQYRVELLTPGQFNFAMVTTTGIDFRPRCSLRRWTAPPASSLIRSTAAVITASPTMPSRAASPR